MLNEKGLVKRMGNYDVNSAYQCLYEDLKSRDHGGQEGRVERYTEAHRKVVNNDVEYAIRKKALSNGLRLTDTEVEDLVGQVNLRIELDFLSYNKEYSFRSWVTNRIAPSVVSKESARRKRDLPQLQPVATSEELEVMNEIWDKDIHKSVYTFNPVEREVMSKIMEQEIWDLCVRTVSSNQLAVARMRIEEKLSSEEIGIRIGKTEKQVNDLFYQFRMKMIPVLSAAGYSIKY